MLFVYSLNNIVCIFIGKSILSTQLNNYFVLVKKLDFLYLIPSINSESFLYNISYSLMLIKLSDFPIYFDPLKLHIVQ